MVLAAVLAIDSRYHNTRNLALTAPPVTSPTPTHVFLTAEQFSEIMGKKVTNDKTYAFNTEQMSVTGEVLLRHISGPASYKRRIVSEFLNIESILNIPLNEVIQKFKVFNDNK